MPKQVDSSRPLTNSKVCAREGGGEEGGGGGGGIGAAWARWQPGTVPPIELRPPRAGRVPPPPAMALPHGNSPSPPIQQPPLGPHHPKQGCPGGGPCWMGSPRGCGRALAACPSADGNRARRYWQRCGGRRSGWGGPSGVSVPQFPRVNPPPLLPHPSLCGRAAPAPPHTPRHYRTISRAQSERPARHTHGQLSCGAVGGGGAIWDPHLLTPPLAQLSLPRT